MIKGLLGLLIIFLLATFPATWLLMLFMGEGLRVELLVAHGRWFPSQGRCRPLMEGRIERYYRPCLRLASRYWSRYHVGGPRMMETFSPDFIGMM